MVDPLAERTGGGRNVPRRLALAQHWVPGRFGVRVPQGCRIGPGDLPDRVGTVVLGRNSPRQAAELTGDYRVLAEVSSRDEAARAARAGAHGLVARGHEAGGDVGELSSFVLLQQLVEAGEQPVWMCRGIGPHTAAVGGGAAGWCSTRSSRC